MYWYTKSIDRDRTRTCNPQIRSLVPYPLGHTVLHVWWTSPIMPMLLPITACCNDLQTKTTLHIYKERLSLSWNGKVRSCGPMDKASDYKSGDCRFESCQDQHFVQANIGICPTMHVLHWFLSEWWGTNVCLINHCYQCVLMNIKACVVECEILQSAHVLRKPLSRLHFPNSMCDNTGTRFWGENAH